MKATLKFLIPCIVLFITILVLNTQIKKSKIYYDKYQDVYQKHDNLLDIVNEQLFVIDSMRCKIDSLEYRFQIFDSKPANNALDILNAIMQVESRGDDSAYAPGEDAAGCLQIRKCMVDDINRILKKKNSNLSYSYNDRWNRQLSIEMFDIFCTYYGLNTAEEMARCWNGGPRGINNPATLSYWNKVEEILVSNE